jgi:pilus assembly protein FimV
VQRNDKHKLLKGAILAAALASLPFGVHAAGMGKITVLSALGQPLRAELDVSGSPDELPSIAARVAPVEAFRQANVEYAAVLSTVKFTLDRRSNGQPFFKIQTDRAVNDPFIDFLVELSWSSGRLVREYAFLLDPPESKIAGSAIPPVAQVPTDSGQMQSAESAPEVSPKAKAKAPIVSTKPQVSDEDKGGERTRKVKSGDTLGKIAAENIGGGVSLDQMLVALFNTNREAFDGSNMNRLRAGKILSLPDLDQVKALNSTEARKIVVAQSSDFNAYRNHLAAVTATKAPEMKALQQSSSGKITPKVEEKQTVAAGKDKLQVSRNEADGKVGKGKAEEDIVARDKALGEANSRIAELEKNLTDLKKLAEMKSQAAAEVQKPAQLAPAPTVAPKDEKGIVAPVVPPPVTDKSAVPPTQAVAVAPETPAAPKVDDAPKPKPKKHIVAPPPPSFVEDNPLLVYGGGAGIVAILGFLGFGFWKRKRDKSGEQGITVSDLAANSVFGAAGGQSVDTSAPLSDFAHSTLDTIEHKEGVDPIQEAEVYMAYGRDGQAEEILLDALQKDPANLAVHVKLLEIYAARKSLPQFATVASDLRTRTGGFGTEWDKAVALGRTIDPSNALYASGVSEPAAEQTQLISPAAEVANMDATIVMSAPIEPAAEIATSAAKEPEPEAASVLDFDLDLGSVDAPSAEIAEPAAVESDAGAVLDMDFDLDLGSADTSAPQEPATGGNAIDFDIASPSVATPAAFAETKSEEPALDFNFDLGDAGSTSEQAPPLDLSSISLDLDSPAPASASDESSEVATKLELAQAYEEMGDREGARELLQEVLAEGSQAQQELAKSKLAQLG